MNLSALITENEVDALVATEADWAYFSERLDEYGDRFQMVGGGEMPDHGTIRWHETMGDALLYAALQRWRGLYVTVLNDVAYDVGHATITRTEP